MPTKLKTVEITAVRGVRHPISLKLDGKSLLIQGDNGTGKSSIVQALDWGLRGKQAPTGAKDTTGQEKYRSHVLESVESPCVKISLTDGSSAEARAGQPTLMNRSESYLAACARSDPFLRRAQLLNFLGQRPVDRFKYLESFLDLDEADTIRNRLSERSAELKARAQQLENDRNRGLQAIVSAIPPGRRPITTSWKAIEETLHQWACELDLVTAPNPDWEELSKAGGVAEERAKSDAHSQERVRCSNILARSKSMRAQALALPDVALASAELDTELRAASKGAQVPLIRAAESYLTKHDDASCPVCDQSISRDEVLKMLRERLQELNTVTQVSVKKSETVTQWHKAYGVWQDLLTAARDERLSSSPVAAAPAGFELLHDAADIEVFGTRVLAIGPQELRTWMLLSLDALDTSIDHRVVQLSKAPQQGELSVYARAIEEAKRQHSGTELVDFLERDVAQEAEHLSLVAESIRKARQDVAQELLDRIAKTVEEFYGMIHPEEEESEVTGAPRIDIQRKSGGIAYLRGQFNAKSVGDPSWVYSDGHLDTVGLCVFLALRRYRADQTSDARLMILDDVVLSIDLGHARRLLLVLKERFEDHQILIFTHNRLFASWVTSLLPSFVRQTITKWSLNDGVRLGDFGTTPERLRRLLAGEPTPKEVAQGMMTVMDEFMSDARYALALSTPARPGDQYTLSELWQPFVKRIGKLEKGMGVPLGECKDIMTRLTDLPRVRNMLAAHDNEFAREFPLTTIRSIAEDALKLIDTVFCAKCSHFVEPVPSRDAPLLVSCRCKEMMYLGKATRDAALIQPRPSSEPANSPPTEIP